MDIETEHILCIDSSNKIVVTCLQFFITSSENKQYTFRVFLKKRSTKKSFFEGVSNKIQKNDQIEVIEGSHSYLLSIPIIKLPSPITVFL